MIRLLALQARRDRVTLAIWIVGIALLIAATSAAVASEFGTAAERAQLLRLALATPALLALRGIPNGDSLGSAVHFQGFAFLAVTVGLMNTFLAVRHGRGDEEQGRREMLGATPVGRSASLVATTLLAVAANVLVVALGSLAYLAAGVELGPAVLSAGALALIGLAFFGIGALCGELLPTSRAANTAATTLVLLAYALRGAGDAAGRADVEAITLVPAWPSGLSPIGWGQAILPFTANDPRPLAAIAALVVAALGAAFAVHARRELGASIVPDRLGPARGGALLGSTVGLFWRLHGRVILPWAVGAAALGSLAGALTSAVADAVLDNTAIQQLLQALGQSSSDDTARLIVSTILSMVGLLAAAAGIQAVLRAREEERDGRAELVLAAPVGRIPWLLSALLVAVATVVSVLGLTSIAVGLSLLGTPSHAIAGIAVAQTWMHAPAALSAVGAAVLLVALLPRLATGLSWGLFGVAAAIGLFGGLLDLPAAVEHASPFSDVPVLPTDEWWPALAVAAAAIVLAAAGALALRRRGIPA